MPHQYRSARRVPPPLSESVGALWPCFVPHPPAGFGLQGFSRPGSRTPLSALALVSFRSAPVLPRALNDRPASVASPESNDLRRFSPPLRFCHPTSSPTPTVKTACAKASGRETGQRVGSDRRPRRPTPGTRSRHAYQTAWTLDFRALLRLAIRSPYSVSTPDEADALLTFPPSRPASLTVGFPPLTRVPSPRLTLSSNRLGSPPQGVNPIKLGACSVSRLNLREVSHLV